MDSAFAMFNDVGWGGPDGSTVRDVAPDASGALAKCWPGGWRGTEVITVVAPMRAANRARMRAGRR